jgi:multiple sugar transport system permease protein
MAVIVAAMRARGGLDESMQVARGARRGALGWIRVALLVVVACAVAWAFVRVGVREAGRVASAVARTAGADEGVELVVMHWSGEGGPEEDEIVERSLRAFEAAHPGLRVRRLNPGDAASFYTKLQTMLASGDPPDVFYVGAERVASFASMGLLRPIDDLLAADDAAGQPGRLRLDDFYEATVEAFRFDGTDVGRGPLFGIPKDFTTVGFYVNLDLFAKAGIQPPSPDWTWDDFIRIARALGASDGPDGIVGTEFVTWPMMLRAYLRTEGVDVRGATFAESRLRDPEVRAALDRLRSWRHDEEGALTSGKSRLATGAAVFTTGTVGMAGPFGRWVVPEYRKIRDFRWDFVPLPRGSVRSNVIATVAWAIARESRHPDEAWKLVRWLTDEKAQREQAALGLAIPTNKLVAESPAFLDPSTPPASDDAYLAPLRDPSVDVRVVDWPADPVYEQLLGSRLDQAMLTGVRTLDQAVAEFESAWERHRASPLARGDFPAFPWRGWAVGAGIACTAVLVVVLLAYRRGGRPASEVREERAGLLFVSPWLLGFALFMAFPIAMSFALSLAKWQGVSTLDEAKYVGLGNYVQLLLHDERFRRSLWVTTYYVLVAVPAGQIFALAAALLMNTKVRGVSIHRAAWYLPSILSGVGVAVLWRWIFDPEAGLMNAVLRPILGAVGLAPPEWFGEDAAVWGVPAFGIMSLATIGGTMMIYLAGLQNIPRDLLEAAAIDRAGRVRRFFVVVLPMLSPVILFNVLMAIIGSFQVFTQAFVMTGGEPGDTTRFYVLYLYNQAFELYSMGYASAMAWILLVIVLAVTLVLMKSSARFVYYEALKR